MSDAIRLEGQTVDRFIYNSEELRRYLFTPHPMPAHSLQEYIETSTQITPQQLKAALAESVKAPDRHLAATLHRLDFINERDLALILSAGFGLPLVDPVGFDIQPEILKMIPVAFARQQLVMPLMMHESMLVVAVTDPADNELLERLQFMTNKGIELAVATRNEILLAISAHYNTGEIANALDFVNIGQTPEAEDTARFNETAQGPLVQLVQNLIADAIIKRASDIHLRPEEDSADILFRIDGELRHQLTLNKRLHATIVSRLKILGGMDISERRIPQDGRARVSFSGKDIDLRLSVVPDVNGEDVVIRLLDSQYAMHRLEDLGYEGTDAERIKSLLDRTSGMFLVTGPTGSGKSTTLYTVLAQIKSDTINIITIEDPVEYHMKGIAQIQVNQQTGYTFAKALRAILRHDPDVIMVGEIRDEETARISVESALTGHLVLSTLHTNSAAATITRFLEIGIPAYLISSTLSGVLAQRLVRSNCPHCLVVEEVSEGIRLEMGATLDELFYKGAGCDKCDQRGTHGRRAVYELLVMTNVIRTALVGGIAAHEIQQLAVDNGMTTLATHALHLAQQKYISLHEAYRVRLD